MNTPKVAIGIAIIALIFSLVALNQSVQVKPLDLNLQSQVRSLQQQAEINKARNRLEDLRQQAVTGGEDFVSRAQTEVVQIREDLRKNYETASENTKKSWQELDKQLEVLQDNLREGGVNVLDAIDRVLENLKSNLKHD